MKLILCFTLTVIFVVWCIRRTKKEAEDYDKEMPDPEDVREALYDELARFKTEGIMGE